jgi:acetamidase/formamidase
VPLRIAVSEVLEESAQANDHLNRQGSRLDSVPSRRQAHLIQEVSAMDSIVSVKVRMRSCGPGSLRRRAMLWRWLGFALCVAAAQPALAQVVPADHLLRSRPENLSWGYIPTDKAPVLTIRSGETVRIDTLSHHGSTQDEEPVAFLGRYGVRPEEVLQDVRDFWASKPGRPRDGRTGVHVLTGPIAIAGAEPGDMLEVQILEVSARVPYGMNTASATSGALGDAYPGARPGDGGADIRGDGRNLIRTAVSNGREVALLADGVSVPLAPFMGIMAVAPAAPTVGQPGVTVAGVQSSRQPGAYGGNLDIKTLTAGATLYLPVFHAGALFYAGDPHGVQGDGEVSGTALEQSATGVFRFVLHKGQALRAPRAETPTHYLCVGIDIDLDRALRTAVQEVIDFLVAEKGLTAGQAFSLASLAIDFTIAEAVNDTQVVYASIPKDLFSSP